MKRAERWCVRVAGAAKAVADAAAGLRACGQAAAAAATCCRRQANSRTSCRQLLWVWCTRWPALLGPAAALQGAARGASLEEVKLPCGSVHQVVPPTQRQHAVLEHHPPLGLAALHLQQAAAGARGRCQRWQLRWLRTLHNARWCACTSSPQLSAPRLNHNNKFTASAACGGQLLMHQADGQRRWEGSGAPGSCGRLPVQTGPAPRR